MGITSQQMHSPLSQLYLRQTPLHNIHIPLSPQLGASPVQRKVKQSLALEDGRVIVFLGPRGMCKSANMTKYGLHIFRDPKQEKKLLLANYPIFKHVGVWYKKHGKMRLSVPLCTDNTTNHKFTIGDPEENILPQCVACGETLVNHIADMQHLISYPAWLKDAVVMIDEIDRWVKRRGTLILEHFDDWTRQLRKAMVWFLCSTQFMRDIPPQLADQMNLVVECHTDDEGRSSTQTRWDVKGDYTGMPYGSWKKEVKGLDKSTWGFYPTDYLFPPLVRHSIDNKKLKAGTLLSDATEPENAATTGTQQIDLSRLLEVPGAEEALRQLLAARGKGTMLAPGGSGQ